MKSYLFLLVLLIGVLSTSCDSRPDYVYVPTAPDTVLVPSPPDTIFVHCTHRCPKHCK